MVHPDYQYTPKLIPAMVCMIVDGLYTTCVLGSRILGGRALAGGMPLWQVRRQSRPDACREHPARHEALRVPHRLPRLLARAARGAAARRRTPTTSSSTTRCWRSGVVRVSDRRGVVPDAIRADASSINFARSVKIRLRLPQYRDAVQAGRSGAAAIARFPADRHRERSGVTHARLLAGRSDKVRRSAEREGGSPPLPTTRPGASARTERRTAAGTARTPRTP